jgi:hypothetical protein
MANGNNNSSTIGEPDGPTRRTPSAPVARVKPPAGRRWLTVMPQRCYIENRKSAERLDRPLKNSEPALVLVCSRSFWLTHLLYRTELMDRNRRAIWNKSKRVERAYQTRDTASALECPAFTGYWLCSTRHATGRRDLNMASSHAHFVRDESATPGFVQFRSGSELVVIAPTGTQSLCRALRQWLSCQPSSKPRSLRVAKRFACSLVAPTWEVTPFQ